MQLDRDELNKKNNEAYKQIYQDFADEAYVDESIKDYIDEVLVGLGRGDTVLDLGCGPGEYCEYLAKKVKAVGLDVSPDFINLAKQKYKDLEFLVRDMRDLPFEDQSISGAILIASLVHIPKIEAPGVLKELKRVLKKDGKVVFVMNLPFNGSVDDGLEARERLGKKITRYFARYTKEEFSKLLLENDFNIIKEEIVTLKTTIDKRLLVLAKVN